jgi:hypothetical protein
VKDRTGQLWVGGMSPWVGVFLVVESQKSAHHWYHHTVNLETSERRTATETSSWEETCAQLDERGCLDGWPWWRLA